MMLLAGWGEDSQLATRGRRIFFDTLPCGVADGKYKRRPRYIA